MSSVIGPIDLGDWRLMAVLLTAIKEHSNEKRFEKAVGKWKALYEEVRAKYQWRGCCDVAVAA